MPRSKKVSIPLASVIRFAQAVLKKKMAGDRAYMDTEIKRIHEELKKHGIDKTMMNAVYGKRWCRNKEAITYDESSCYYAFFKNVGGTSLYCKNARELFANPVAWIMQALTAHLDYLGGKITKQGFIRQMKETFGERDPTGNFKKENLKEFYTRFYGKSTPKGTSVEDALKSEDAVIKLGILVRLQNTLHVAEVTKSLRDHDPNAVIQVQYDAVTIWLPAIKTHPKYGVAQYNPSCGYSWFDWLGHQFSNGVSTWTIEMHPDVAIFSGVKNRYAAAWREEPTEPTDGEWVDLKPLKFKLNPQNMIGATAEKNSELKNAPEFAKKAKALLCQALYEGESSFAKVLDKIPRKIQRGDKTCEPTLYGLLKPFVKQKREKKKMVYYYLSAARNAASSEDVIIGMPKTPGNKSRKWKIIPATEFFSDADNALTWKKAVGNEYHEQVYGNVHPFGEYDAKDYNDEPLDTQHILNMEKSMKTHFEKKAGEKVTVKRYATASLEKPNNLHLSWRATTESGRLCVLANPGKDMAKLLGKSSTFLDSKPWKNSLRMPGCPYDKRPDSSYLDKTFLESDAPEFDDDAPAESLAKQDLEDWVQKLTGKEYSDYCISARGLVNPVVIGVPPPKRKVTTGREQFLFPSENMLVQLLVDIVHELTKEEYTMTTGKTGLDDVNASADTVYQRIQFTRKFSSSEQKLLDLHDFAERYLEPYIEGKQDLPKLKDLRHRKGNSSYLSIIIPRTAVPYRDGSGENDAYFPIVRLKSFEAKKRKRRTRYVELPSSFLMRVLQFKPDKGKDWLEKFRTAREKETRHNIPSTKLPLNRTDSQTSYKINAYDVRNAIRERLSAKRVPANSKPHNIPHTSYYVTAVFAGITANPDLLNMVKTKEIKTFEGLYKAPLPFQRYLLEWMYSIDTESTSSSSVPCNATIRQWIEYTY